MAANGVEAVEMANRLRPTLITMDLWMPGMDGLMATEQIMADCPTRIVIISSGPARRRSRRATRSPRPSRATMTDLRSAGGRGARGLSEGPGRRWRRIGALPDQAPVDVAGHGECLGSQAMRRGSGDYLRPMGCRLHGPGRESTVRQLLRWAQPADSPGPQPSSASLPPFGSGAPDSHARAFRPAARAAPLPRHRRRAPVGPQVLWRSYWPVCPATRRSRSQWFSTWLPDSWTDSFDGCRTRRRFG